MIPVQPTSIGIMLVSDFRQPWSARARSAVPRVILGSCGAQAHANEQTHKQTATQTNQHTSKHRANHANTQTYNHNKHVNTV